MAFSVSHWSGRLGNNIQQVANCILAAEKHNTDFTQTLDHDIISKFNVNFASNNINQSGYTHGQISRENHQSNRQERKLLIEE